MLHLKPGVYEGNVKITAPITIIGDEHVTLTADNEQPIITITANEVNLENFIIEDRGPAHDEPTILINSDNNKVTNVKIKTNRFGIKLDHAHHNTISHVHITGNKNNEIGSRRHGIDLWKSDHNIVHSSIIKDVQDGIYIESSNYNTIHHNKATNSRYGYHLMFTEKNEIKANQSYNNISGIMVMGTEGTKVIDNNLQYNQKSVQSLGLFIYDVENATVTGNLIANNRIGIFLEDASDNDITLNQIEQNYVGIQFKRAENNQVNENSLIANVIQGQAERSSNNDTNGNFWGDHSGIDANGDGLSNLQYTVDPFFLNLTTNYQPFQLFFQAPGMVFLEHLLHTPTDQWLVDKTPLMDSPLNASSVQPESCQIGTLFLSLILFLISSTIIFMGVRSK